MVQEEKPNKAKIIHSNLNLSTNRFRSRKPPKNPRLLVPFCTKNNYFRDSKPKRQPFPTFTSKSKFLLQYKRSESNCSLKVNASPCNSRRSFSSYFVLQKAESKSMIKFAKVMVVSDQKPPICQNKGRKMPKECKCEKTETSTTDNNKAYKEDVYGRILGPTPDEAILTGLQTVMDMCSCSSKHTKRLYKIDSKKVIDWVNSQYILLDQEISNSASDSSIENIAERKENLHEIEELIRKNSKLERRYKNASNQMKDSALRICLCPIPPEEKVDEYCCCEDNEDTSMTSSAFTTEAQEDLCNVDLCSCSSSSTLSETETPKYKEAATKMSNTSEGFSTSDDDRVEEPHVSKRRMSPSKTENIYMQRQSTNSNIRKVASENTSSGTSTDPSIVTRYNKGGTSNAASVGTSISDIYSDKSIQVAQKSTRQSNKGAQTSEARNVLKCKCSTQTEIQRIKYCKCAQTLPVIIELSSASSSSSMGTRESAQTTTTIYCPNRQNNSYMEKASETNGVKNKTEQCNFEVCCCIRSTQTLDSSPDTISKYSQTQQPSSNKKCTCTQVEGKTVVNQCCQSCNCKSVQTWTDSKSKSSRASSPPPKEKSMQSQSQMAEQDSFVQTSFDDGDSSEEIDNPQSPEYETYDQFPSESPKQRPPASPPASFKSSASSDQCYCDRIHFLRRVQFCTPKNCPMLRKGVISICSNSGKFYQDRTTSSNEPTRGTKVEMCHPSTCSMLKNAVVNIAERFSNSKSASVKSPSVDQGTQMNFTKCPKKNCPTKCTGKKGKKCLEMYNGKLYSMLQNNVVNLCPDQCNEKRSSLTNLNTIQQYKCENKRHKKHKTRDGGTGYGDFGKKLPPPGDIRYAMVKITTFPEYSTFEILKPSNSDLTKQSSRIESVFVLKNKR